MITADEFIQKYVVRCPAKILRKFIGKIKNVSYSKVMFHADEINLSKKEISQLSEMINRYESREPISKILNEREFWKSKFFVDRHVLDPRPETEIILERSLELFDKNQKFDFLDIGTGSGCILLSLAKEFPYSHGIGIDISPEAMRVAKFNKENLKITNTDIQLSDWNKFHSEKQFDLIVSNPPYIKSDDIQNLDENVKNFDPILALDGGSSGLLAYEQLSSMIKTLLKPEGILLLEIGIDQHDSIKEIFETKGFHLKNTLRDLQGIPRIEEFNPLFTFISTPYQRSR